MFFLGISGMSVVIFDETKRSEISTVIVYLDVRVCVDDFPGYGCNVWFKVVQQRIAKGQGFLPPKELGTVSLMMGFLLLFTEFEQLPVNRL